MDVTAHVKIVRIDTEQMDKHLAESAAVLLRGLVAAGAAIGWVDPPPVVEVEDLLSDVAQCASRGDTSLVIARRSGQLAGLGYWRRYGRPTHRPHADVEKVAVDPAWQGDGIGRALMHELVLSATQSGVEILTLDLRADNTRAAALYESLGFRRYGYLERFVAVGAARYDTLFYALDLHQSTA